MEKNLALTLENVASEALEVSPAIDRALSDLELVCIGGGIGDVVFA